MLNIAISGINGFIGKNLTKFLDDNQINYFSIDNYLLEKKISFEEIDFNIPQFDVLIHLAAKSYIPDSFNSPYIFYNDNFSTTLKCLELARIKGAAFLYFSSYVYGRPNYLPVNELHPLNPINTYSRSKLICEDLCKGYANDFKVPCVILRPFNIYGPLQKSSFLIPKIISQAILNKSVVLNDPLPRRDFLHVQDLINAVYKIIVKEFPLFEIYNIGSGESYSVSEVVQIVQEFLPEITVSFNDLVRASEISETISDSSKFALNYNWKPNINFKEGIESLIKESIKSMNGIVN